MKSDASALFGRYAIALAMRAAFERVAVADRNPAFLIVDEAAEYFDENLETLLSQARKFNMAVLFAHQYLDQLSAGLRASVAANTSIKLAGGVSDRDARALAPDMRTTAEFIAAVRKHAGSTEFACYIRNQTANAVRLNVPFGTLEGAPRMSSDDLAGEADHPDQSPSRSAWRREPEATLDAGIAGFHAPCVWSTKGWPTAAKERSPSSINSKRPPLKTDTTCEPRWRLPDARFPVRRGYRSGKKCTPAASVAASVKSRPALLIRRYARAPIEMRSNRTQRPDDIKGEDFAAGRGRRPAPIPYRAKFRDRSEFRLAGVIRHRGSI